MPIRYKAEAMPRKSMVQGYKTSNRTRTGPRTTGNGYTILKGSVLFSYSGKKGGCGTLSYKNDDRHPYDKRNTDTATKLDLLEFENLFDFHCHVQIGRDMNSMEKSMLLDELFALRKADKEERDRLLEKLDRMTEQLMNLNESSQMQMKQNEELKQMIANLQKQNELLQKENAALKEQKKQDRKNRTGGLKAKRFPVRKRRKHLLMKRTSYNVYMYIDKKLVNTEHLRCWLMHVPNLYMHRNRTMILM